MNATVTNNIKYINNSFFINFSINELNKLIKNAKLNTINIEFNNISIP